jgi:hypothetical protein
MGHANVKTTETYAHVNEKCGSASLNRRGSLSQPGADCVQIDREEEPGRQKNYVLFIARSWQKSNYLENA